MTIQDERNSLSEHLDRIDPGMSEMRNTFKGLADCIEVVENDLYKVKGDVEGINLRLGEIEEDYSTHG